MVAAVLLGLPTEMHVHLGVQHPFGQRLLQIPYQSV